MSTRTFNQMYRAGIRKHERTVRVREMPIAKLVEFSRRQKNPAMFWAARRAAEYQRMMRETEFPLLRTSYMFEANWWRLAAIRAYLGVH